MVEDDSGNENTKSRTTRMLQRRIIAMGRGENRRTVEAEKQRT